jgi:hypothetical protein
MVPTAEQRCTRFPNYKQTAITKSRGENGKHILKNQTHIVHIKIERFKHLTKKNGWPDLPSPEYS